jgi:hypothetical protein
VFCAVNTTTAVGCGSTYAVGTPGRHLVYCVYYGRYCRRGCYFRSTITVGCGIGSWNWWSSWSSWCGVQQHATDHTGDDENFTLIIHRTLNDVSRRKRNVVISGLAESAISGKSDREVFEEFCECFLPLKPSLAGGNCCQRIGKSINGKPRRLLVKLSSEESASALIDAAPSLRRSFDGYVSANVFISADLSPSAAKLAFESRKKRRELHNRRASAAAAAATVAGGTSYSEMSNSPARAAAAPSFPSSSSNTQSDVRATCSAANAAKLTVGGGLPSSSAVAAAGPQQHSGNNVTTGLNINAPSWSAAGTSSAVGAAPGVTASTTATGQSAAPGGGSSGGGQSASAPSLFQ